MRMSNNFDPDQAQRFVRPALGKSKKDGIRNQYNQVSHLIMTLCIPGTPKRVLLRSENPGAIAYYTSFQPGLKVIKLEHSHKPKKSLASSQLVRFILRIISWPGQHSLLK